MYAPYMHAGWSHGGSGFFRDAFAFDRSLERLAFHPAIWSLVLELTAGRPQLRRGTMLHDHSQQNPQKGGLMHSAREV